ncbi:MULTISPECIES: hypothetical protein [Legionella]|uniref:hypothetical protein n=1 Tax=Legionella TaxID=445 RepID=UPI001ACAE936|nr:hypothetical protein [Legionella sp. 39-23]MBN9228424.1 hypothetical protein [Legionella steelei]
MDRVLLCWPNQPTPANGNSLENPGCKQPGYDWLCCGARGLGFNPFKPFVHND